MSEKKYFWLKLPRDFFNKHYIKILRAKDDGDLLVLFYIRLLTESIDHEGKLRYSDTKPYSPETIAEATGFPLQFVTSALQTLTDMELVVTDADGTITLPKCAKMIGSEGGSASRVREYRKRQQEKKIEGCNTDNKKAEQDKAKDGAEKEKKPKKEKIDRPEYKEIVDYFNELAGTHYRHTSKHIQEGINARLSEGYTVDDIKEVIRIKTKKWLKDPKMIDYLRPETLLRPSHFGSYLEEAKRDQPKVHSGLGEKLEKEVNDNLKDFVDDGVFN